ncbi:MAG: hypothetical protein MI806_07425 [Minwuiales bacterium]|nr:hypothetical protein [Minwuiales bacterium]
MTDRQAVAAAPADMLYKAGLAVGAIVALAVVNQYVLRFLMDSDLFAALTPVGIAENDAIAFAAAPHWFVLYAAATALAVLSGPAAVRASIRGDRGPASGIFLAACVAAALLGAVVAFALGTGSVGGTDLLFYWSGLAYVWLVAVGVSIWGISTRRRVVARDWLIHSYGLALLPITIYPMIPFWAWAMDMSIGGAASTAVTLAFAGHFLVSFYVTVQLLERR